MRVAAPADKRFRLKAPRGRRTPVLSCGTYDRTGAKPIRLQLMRNLLVRSGTKRGILDGGPRAMPI